MLNNLASRLVLAAFLSFFLITALFYIAYPKPLEVSTVKRGVVSHSVQLPWTFSEVGEGNVLIARLHVSTFTPRTWQIIPDDHLRSINIDNTSIDLSIFGEAVNDYSKGFRLDLSPYFTDGQEAVITFVVDNSGYDGGLDLKPVIPIWFWLLAVAAFLPFICALSNAFRLLPKQLILLCLTLIPIAFYWADTPWMVRAYDVNHYSGHYSYIKYVATKMALPSPTEGWTYYHPPAYYAIGALFWKWADWLKLPTAEFIRVYGLFLWFIFLISSAGAIRKVLDGRYTAIYIASAALFVWPSAIMHSVTIGNDIALYACTGLIMWFMVLWRAEPHKSFLLWMGMFCGFSLLCKSSALPVVAACGLLVAMRMLPHQGVSFNKGLKETFIFSMLAGAGLIASFLVRIYSYLNGQTAHWMISNVQGLPPELMVPAGIKSFIPLDIPTFITVPWMHSWSDESSRYNFWNFMLRSSLTGEFSFEGKTQVIAAYIFGGILLILCFYLLANTMRLINLSVKQFKSGTAAEELDVLPWLLMGVFSLLSLIAIRIQLPYSCSGDFRYILPVLVPFLIGAVSVGLWIQRLLILFCAISVVFFVSL